MIAIRHLQHDGPDDVAFAHIVKNLVDLLECDGVNLRLDEAMAANATSSFRFCRVRTLELRIDEFHFVMAEMEARISSGLPPGMPL